MSQLLISDARDFCSPAYAAEKAGCSIRTVTRAIRDGLLDAQAPRLGKGEARRGRVLLLVGDVDAWADARKRAGK